MRPTIYIGLGGTGIRAIAQTKKMYEDAYYYFKEASEFDILNSKNFYMMAKCACEMNNKDSALAHFSVMKRLAPKNIEYIKE